MTARDLTRWNRAGLRRFRYVQGNAADFLEQIRSQLVRRFPGWKAIGRKPDPDPVEERRRVLDQYREERRDQAWEIARAFARACHVLTEHVDAFANEGYVETATQWDLLRRLVEMLGYHPAPPASASTVLALLAKPGEPGPVAAGFAVKHAPADGGAPVVFETLADVVVDARLNDLRLASWNRSEESFDPYPRDPLSPSPWRAPPSLELSVGQPALLLQRVEGRLRDGAPAIEPRVRVVDLARPAVEGEVRLDPGGTPGEGWYRGFTRVLVGPKRAHRPRLNGPRVVQLDRPHGLAPGDVLAWVVEKEGWRFAAVESAEGDALVLADRTARPAGPVYRAAVVAPVVNADVNPVVTEFRLPLTLVAAAARGPAGGAPAAIAQGAFEVHPIQDMPAYYVLKSDAPARSASALYVVLSGATPIGQAVARRERPPVYRFDGAPGGLVSGAWVVAEYRDGSGLRVRRPARVRRVEAREDDFTLELEDGEGALSTPDDRERALLAYLRRIEAALDQPLVHAVTLGELAAGALRSKSVEAVEGAGPLGSGSWSDRLAHPKEKIGTVGDLAALPPDRAIPGVPDTVLRQLRTLAEVLVSPPGDLGGMDGLLGKTIAQILGLERGRAARGSAFDASALQLLRVQGPFQETLQPAGHDRNATPLPDRGTLTLELASSEPPPQLKGGRLVVLEQEGGGAAHPTRLKKVVLGEDGGVRLELVAEVPASAGFSFGNTVIRANAAPAGHGEGRGERVLGSGVAAQLNQEFVLDVPGISFVADSTMPSGVRADVAVTVDGARWRHVASLRDSGQADADYTVRLTEEGYLRVGFGDGQNGRRLPSGTNNVRVRYRLGAGLAGNLPARRLETPLKPHARVAAVRQPLPALGGNDLESVAGLRESAPASLLTLERAVSVVDFANLAASQSGVWHARAFRRPARRGRSGRIEIVVVPAGGAPLDADDRPVIPKQLLDEQRETVLRHAPPGVDVTVVGFEAVLVDLSVKVRVRFAAYGPGAVADAVQAALRDAFALRRRRLGQALRRSDVYQVLEEVAGVENSICAIEVPSEMRKRVRRVLRLGAEIDTVEPLERQVIYVDPDRSAVKVLAEEYRP